MPPAVVDPAQKGARRSGRNRAKARDNAWGSEQLFVNVAFRGTYELRENLGMYRDKETT